jgi:hypothetical protein
MVLLGVLVQRHWLLLAQVCPYEQQPPPRAEGQANIEVVVHWRGQHAGKVVVDTGVAVVMVAVPIH